MAGPAIGLSDGEILDHLLTRRDIARIAAAGALVVASLPVDAPLQGREALAQSADGTATVAESTIYRPATPVGSPQPEPTGPAETTVGPAPGEASPVPGVPIESFIDTRRRWSAGEDAILSGRASPWR